MATEESSSIFRKEAIEQASSVEQLDQLMQVVNLKDWLPLTSIGALLAAALIWSFMGRIPMFTESKGLLINSANNPDQLISISYFPIGQGKQIQPGDQILIVPDTINIQEFGGIEATVTQVSAAAVTQQAALNRTKGNQELAQLVYTPASIEVVAQLTPDSSTATGYKWSMSQGPDTKLSSETPATSKVLLQEKAPITYVFPFLGRGQ